MDSTFMKRCIGGILCASAMLASSAAMAEIVSFNVVWAPCDLAGHFYEGTASATAMFTMDTKYVSDGPGNHQGSITMDKLLNLSVTVTGTGAGDGTFGKNDFTAMEFSYDHVLNFSGELIGQYTPSGLPFDYTGHFGTSIGTSAGLNGDFNLFAKLPGGVGGPAAAPSGVYPFVMLSNGNPMLEPSGGIDVEHSVLGVKSIIATAVSAVPEPSSYAMLLGGLGLVGLMARRNRSQP